MNKPHSPACDRNRDPILDVLREHFIDARRVLEIGSGTGQHAAYFAAHLPQVVWQATDREENLPGIRIWLDDADLSNTPAPLALDVGSPWPHETYDAVFSANTLHIMAWPEVEQFFAQLPHVTTAGATLVVYGPFNEGGRYNSPSNAAFDQSLKARGAHMGIRDAEAVDALAKAAGFVLIDDAALPANNRCRVWRRIDGQFGLHGDTPSEQEPATDEKPPAETSMHAYRVFDADHWQVSHRQDARYPGYLMVSSRESVADLSDLSDAALQELGLVLKKTEDLLRSLYAPCKVIFYKLGFSSGFSCHFHVAPITPELLAEISAHPDFPDDPDGNDAIVFLSRIYCERALTERESTDMRRVIDSLKNAAIAQAGQPHA